MYVLEFKIPKARNWGRLSGRKLSPFTEQEIADSQQMIAERVTVASGKACLAQQIEITQVEVQTKNAW